MSDGGEVTQLLARLGADDPKASEDLYRIIYDELRGLARRQMRRERAGHTLDTTGLVHEAFMKLIGQNRVEWQSRGHFLSVASMAMRRVLLNYAERRLAQKRGSGEILATLDNDLMGAARPEELIALDDALGQLSSMDARQARVVELRFFGGLTHDEIAKILEVSEPTVRRDWRSAKAWLKRELTGS